MNGLFAIENKDKTFSLLTTFLLCMGIQKISHPSIFDCSSQINEFY